MILVTGGTGFVGRRLVNQLAASGESIRVLSRRRSPPPPAPGAIAVTGDLCDPISLDAALTGVDAVIHLAGRLPARGDPSDLARVNVEGTAALARAAGGAGVSRFVHASSAGVYGNGLTREPHRETDPPNPGDAYERSKLAGEAALRDALAGSAVRWTILRPAGVYGPGRPATLALFREVGRRRFWLHGPVPVIVHPTYVDDVTAALRLILGRDDLVGEIFNVGGERALGYTELIEMIGTVMGRRPLQLSAPGWTGCGAAAAAGIWRAVARSAPARLERLGLPLVNRALDTSKARRVLGFAPTPLAQGLEETAASLRNGTAA